MGLFSKKEKPAPESKSVQRRKALQKTATPIAPKVAPVDNIAKALAMAYIRGKLHAKGHPKADDHTYLERSIGTIWKTFLADARAVALKS